MMKVRRQLSALPQLDTWPELDPNALSEPRRARFVSLRNAIAAYVDGESLDQIEALTSVGRRQLYRTLDRCMKAHPDGRVWGWRALAPYTRVCDYQRTKAPVLAQDAQAGLAGAFDQLLNTHPGLRDWIRYQAKRKRVTIDQLGNPHRFQTRLRGLKHLHRDFCRRALKMRICPQKMRMETVAKVPLAKKFLSSLVDPQSHLL